MKCLFELDFGFKSVKEHDSPHLTWSIHLIAILFTLEEPIFPIGLHMGVPVKLGFPLSKNSHLKMHLMPWPGSLVG